jgi:hypothetical protein
VHIKVLVLYIDQFKFRLNHIFCDNESYNKINPKLLESCTRYGELHFSYIFIHFLKIIRILFLVQDIRHFLRPDKKSKYFLFIVISYSWEN